MSNALNISEAEYKKALAKMRNINDVDFDCYWRVCRVYNGYSNEFFSRTQLSQAKRGLRLLRENCHAICGEARA